MRLAPSLLAVLLFTVARPASAATRLAVFILAEEASLSNDLTEVAIARLAERPGYELLGLRELETRLGELETVKNEGVRACLTSAACLSEVGAMARVEGAVVGDVRREDSHYRLEFSFVDAKTGSATRRLSRESAIDVAALIDAVQVGVFELVPNVDVETRPASPSPTPEGSATPRRVDEGVGKSSPPKKSEDGSIVPYIAFGSAGLAVVAFSAAVVTGTIGAAEPTGKSRAEVQEDVARRQRYADASNGLFVAGGLLAGVSVVSFAISW